MRDGDWSALQKGRRERFKNTVYEPGFRFFLKVKGESFTKQNKKKTSIQTVFMKGSKHGCPDLEV